MLSREAARAGSIVVHLTRHFVLAAAAHWTVIAAIAAHHHHVLVVSCLVGLTTGMLVHHTGIHSIGCCLCVVLCCVSLCLEKSVNIQMSSKWNRE